MFYQSQKCNSGLCSLNVRLTLCSVFIATLHLRDGLVVSSKMDLCCLSLRLLCVVQLMVHGEHGMAAGTSGNWKRVVVTGETMDLPRAPKPGSGSH